MGRAERIMRGKHLDSLQVGSLIEAIDCFASDNDLLMRELHAIANCPDPRKNGRKPQRCETIKAEVTIHLL